MDQIVRIFVCFCLSCFSSFAFAKGHMPAYLSVLSDEALLPLEIEGVYEAQGPLIDNKVIDFNVTVLRHFSSGQLSVTISSKKTGQIFFFASQVIAQKMSDEKVQVESFGRTMRGARKHIKFDIDSESRQVTGIINTNFFSHDQGLILEGTKSDSVLEELIAVGSRQCGDKKDYLGVYEGVFGPQGNKKFILQEMATGLGQTTLTANIEGATKIYYHDGVFHEEVGAFEFESANNYSINGHAKKLFLVCESDEEFYYLKGIHIATNGHILRDILFKKRKAQD